MLAEIILLIAALLFFILGMFLFYGKGSWLIAGYNTMSEKTRNSYDKIKVCRAIAVLCMVCCIILCAIAWMGFLVDTGKMAEKQMLIPALGIIAVLAITVTAVLRYILKFKK